MARDFVIKKFADRDGQDPDDVWTCNVATSFSRHLRGTMK